MKRFASLLVFGLILSASFGQTSGNYAFSQLNTASLSADMNGNPLNMITGTSQIIGPAQDSALSATLAIGFDFYFMGTCMNTFACNENGLVELGSRTIAANSSSVSSSVIPNLLAPFAFNMQTGIDGDVRYKVFGTPPNRLCVIEYHNVMIGFNPGGATGGNATFQVRLYENGIIEYVYGQMATNSSFVPGSIAEIGWEAANAANKFMAIDSLGNQIVNGGWPGIPLDLNTSISNLHSSNDGSRKSYRFVPNQSGLAQPGTPTFSSIASSSITINWIDNSMNETDFNIFRSQDNINFIKIATVASTTIASTGSGYSYVATGLIPNFVYYFRIVANSEGVASLPVNGTQITGQAKAYQWIANGNVFFSDPSNWNPVRTVPDPTDTLRFENGSNSTLQFVPTFSTAKISVSNNTTIHLMSVGGSTVTISAKIANVLQITPGSSLLLDAPVPNVVTLSFGTGSGATANVAGSLSVENGNTLSLTGCAMTVTGTLGNSGTINGANIGSLIFSANGIYNHKYNLTAGTVPTATWNAGSTCLITGYTVVNANLTSLTGQSLYNLTWNCPGQVGNVNLEGNVPAVISGTLKVISGSMRIATNTSPTLNVNNFEQTGGSFDLNTGAGGGVMRVTGTFNQTGGLFCSFINSVPMVEFAGTTGIQNANFYNSSPQSGMTLRIVNSAGINLTGSGAITNNFILNSSGGIRISTPALVPINTNLNFIYNNSSTMLTYDCPSGCTMTAKEFPTISGPANLTINMTDQIVKMPFSRTIPGSLVMSGGDIDVGANSFSLGSSTINVGGLQWTAGNIRLTTGSMTRWFNTNILQGVPGTGVGFYPIAFGPSVRHVSVYGSSQLSSGGSLTITQSNVPGITSGLALNDNSYIIQRRTNSSWTFVSNGIVVNGSTFGIRIFSSNLFTSNNSSNLRILKSNSIVGTNVSGSFTGNVFRAERNALNTAAVNSTFYIGASDVDLDPYYVAIQSGNWNNPSTWNTGVVPVLTNNVEIAENVNVTLDADGQCKNLLISSSSSITIPANTLLVDNAVSNYGSLTITGGNLTINGGPIIAGQGLTDFVGSTFLLNSGNLTIGTSGGFYKRWTHSGGNATITGGTVSINGNLSITNGNFTQNGGNIFLDANSGISAGTSILSGNHIFSVTGGNISFQAGTITIVDPPFPSNTTSMAVSIKLSTTNLNAFGGTHTFIFGGNSTSPGHTTNGFVIETTLNSLGGRVPLNNVIVNGGSGSGRFVRNTLNASNATQIKGTLTINPGSEYRIVSNTNQRDCYGSAIINNGTFTAAGTLTLGGEQNIYSINTPQTISGSGVFRNLVTNSTGNFTSIILNNSGGITTSIGNISFTGSLTFATGNLKLGNDTLTQLVGGTTIGTPTTSCHVIGAYRQYAPTGATVLTYPIGDVNFYTPINIIGNAGAVITAGYIAARSIPSEHPQILSSGLSSSRGVNRYFSIKPDNNISFVPASMSTIFNWTFSDNDPFANAGNFLVAQTQGSGWTIDSVRNKVSTQIRVVNLSSFGDFVIGEPCNVGASFSYSTNTYCNTGTTIPVITTGSQTGTFTSTTGLSINSSSGIINLGASTPGTYLITNTVNIGGCPVVSDTGSIKVTGTSFANVTVSPSANPSCSGKPVTFTATPVNGGTPTFQWIVNHAGAGNNSPVLTLPNVVQGDVISCIMTSSLSCATGNPANSTLINMTVNPTPATPVISSVGSTFVSCLGTVTLASSYTGSGNIWTPGGATTDTISANAGAYSVKYTNSFGCVSDPSPNVVVTLVAPNTPLNGNYTIGNGPQSCTNYLSFAAAIRALNKNGVDGPVIFDIPAGYVETAPDTGLYIKMCGLPSGLQSNSNSTITFQKSGVGNNPLIYAGTGNSNSDAIIKIVGTDFVTFNGINLTDTSNASVLEQMEWGFALLKCDGTNGAQWNTIKNCRITLKRTNLSTAGIYMNNHTGETNIGLSYTGGIGFENNFKNLGNSFYGNTIQNAYTGISVHGSSAVNDSLNNIGIKNSPHNLIQNFGGSVVPAIGISFSNQKIILVTANDITGGDSTVSTVTGINAAAQSGISGEISGNKISLSSNAISGIGITGINISSITNGDELTVADNIIENCVFTSGTTASFNGINSAFSGTSLQTIRKNLIRNNNLTTISNGNFTGINLIGNPAGLNIDSNTISGNRLSGTGTFNGILVSDSLISFRVGWNSILDNKKTGVSGTFNCIAINSPSDNTITGNNMIDNGIPASNGTPTINITGINHLNGSGNEVVSDNVLRKLFVGGTSSSVVQLSGFRNFNNAISRTISGNKIDSLYSIPNANILAINSITSAGPVIIRNNKIYDVISGGAGGTVCGIFISNQNVTVTISNNYIGNLFTPVSINPCGIRGMELGGVATIGVYFNTIRLSAESTSNLFGSAGILAGFTSTLDMRNNIIVNTSTPGGIGGLDGVTTAYRRTNSTLTSYASTSNRNVFYAGIPGDNNLIYCEGFGNPVTNPKITLADYKLFVSPRDNVSSTENVAFKSITGRDSTFLHIRPDTLTVIEGNALPVAGITNDYDGDIRNILTPDIGADESALMGISPSVSLVTPTPAAGRCTAVAHVMNALIIPGINPTAGVTISYSFNGVSQGTLPMSNVSGNNWQATIPAAIPSNAVVSWLVNASDGTYSQSQTGSYQDEVLSQYNIKTYVTSTPSFVCGTDTTRLSAFVEGTGQAPNTYCTPVHTAASRCITNVILNKINNITAAQSCILPSYTLFSQSGQTTTSLIAGKTYPLFVSTNSNAMVWVWIDSNRNGIFDNTEGTLVYTSSLSGQVNLFIPANAVIGGTRMRIRSTNPNGTLTKNDACTSIASGESEDYIINIIPDLTFNWSPATGLSSSTVSNPLATVSSTITYTVTASDVNGCTLPSLDTSVTINSTTPPTAPTATNSTQCGSGVPACSVSSSSSFFNWYQSQTGGSPIAGQHGSSLTNFSILSTKNFWVAAFDGTCESPRTQVTAFVNQPDSVKAIPSATAACLPSQINLQAIHFGNSNSYTYSWSCSQTGSGITGSVPGQSISVTPTGAGTFNYILTATDVAQTCNATSTATVTVNGPPIISHVNASPTLVCPGDTTTLFAFTTVSGTAILGTDTLQNSKTNGWPTPYGGFFGGTKSQYLFKASELVNAGLDAGNITALTFKVKQLSSISVYNGFTIKIGHTSANVLGSNFIATTMTQVIGPVNYTPVTGNNKHTFQTPFNWDGTSNIIVEICFNNNSNGNNTGNVVVNSSATNFVSSSHSGLNQNLNVCSQTISAGQETIRPNIVFDGKVLSADTTTLSWQWNPGSLAGNIVKVIPQTATTYTVKATSKLTSCTSTATIGITLNSIPPSPTGHDSTHCGAGVPLCYVTGGNSFRWYDQNGIIPGENNSSLTNYISASTTTYQVRAFDGTCLSLPAAVKETVSQSDSISISTSGAACTNTPIQFSAIQHGSTNNFAFVWTSDTVPGSGISSPVSGQSINVTPTDTGFHTYKVTGTDLNCKSVASVTLNAKISPVVSSATSSEQFTCSGAPVQLSATSFAVTGHTAIVGTGSVTNSTTTYPTPYGHAFGGAKEQYLLLASELAATGFQAGNITSLGFEVVNLPTSGGNVLQNFNISVGTTNLTSLPNTIQNGINGMTTVFSSNVTLTTGVNTHVFSTPFVWDGTSNLLLQICFNNNDTGAVSGGNAVVRQMLTTFASTIEYHRSSSATVCTSVGTSLVTSYFQRPVLFMGGTVGDNVTSTLNWNWTPGNLQGSTVSAVSSTPGTNTFTVTATDSFGCSASSSVSVFFNPLSPPPATLDSSHCGNQLPLCSVNSGGFIRWYLTPTGGTALPNENGTTLLYHTTSSTTTYYVSDFDGLCETARSVVVETVTPADSVSVTTSSSSICEGTQFTLTAHQNGNTNQYTYNWTCDPGGGLTLSSGTQVNAAPSVPGILNYTSTATDGACKWITPVQVISHSAPSVNATANATTLCLGSTAQLNAQARLSGNAVHLNGVNQYVIIPTSADLSLDRNFTIEAWINPLTASNGEGIVSKNQSFSVGSYTLHLTYNGTNVGIESGGNYFVPSQPSVIYPADWNHIAVVFSQLAGNNNSVTMYVNGVTVATGISTVSLNQDSLRIGLDFGGKYFGGDIDEVRIWKVALNQSTIQTWRNKPITNAHPFYSNLVAYYDFNITNGNIVIDRTGRGNNGYLVNNAQILSSLAPLDGGFSYQWSPSGDLNNSTVQSPVVTPSLNGINNYNILATANNGCTTTAQTSITTISSHVTPSITIPNFFNTFCNSGSNTLAQLIPRPGSQIQWQSSPDSLNWNDIPGATGSTYFTGTITNTTYYRMYVTCSVVDTSNVIKLTIDVPSITSVTNGNRCGPGIVNLSATGNGTIEWFANSTQGNAIFTGNTYSTSISSDVTYWVQSRIGTCIFAGLRQPVLATTTTSPAVGISVTASTVCSGSPATLTALSSNDPNYSYTWMPGNLQGSSVTVSPVATTIYTVTAIDTTSGGNSGCASSATATITANVLPVTPIISPAAPAICTVGGSVTMSVSNPQISTVYRWIPVGNLGATITVSPTSTTNYSVTATRSNGCTVSSQAVTVTYNPITPPTISVIGTTSLCQGRSDSLKINGTYNSYSWSIGGTVISTNQKILISPSSNTTYTATVSNGTCTSSTTQLISVLPFTPLTLSTSNHDSTFCSGDTITLSANSGYSAYAWLRNGSFAGTTSSIPVSSAGNYSVTVSAANGCSSSAGINIASKQSPSTPIVSPTGPIYLCENGSNSPATLWSDTTGAGPGSSLSWNDVNISGGSQLDIYYNDLDFLLNNNSYTYFLSVTNLIGCTRKSNSVDVHVINCGASGVVLNTRLFLEAFYMHGTGGLMNNYGFGGSLYLNGISNDLTDVDTIRMSLMDPIDFHLVETKTGILKTNGYVSVTFSPNIHPGESYFIRVKHRNAIETWSAAPVLLTALTQYDFTTGQSKAYGNNMVLTSDGLYWAFYSGDISGASTASLGIQDGIIEGQDYLEIENAVALILSGYVVQDISGDGTTEALDYLILENNTAATITVMRP